MAIVYVYLYVEKMQAKDFVLWFSLFVCFLLGAWLHCFVCA